ncbi:MAG TPA: phospholipase D-like domain-containing protein [Methylomirabilota bacterium]
MRFKSARVGGYQVFAVSGVNTISFGIDAAAAAKPGLLGFAVERVDAAADERYVMPGFKVFPSLIPHPDEHTQVSTWDHPVQSFVWDDFTAKPEREYRYLFHPLKGKPKNLDRSAAPVPIDVRTEPLFSTLEHDVFFNRGVASSQAYARRFGNKKPDELPPARRAEALQWLTRELDDAVLRFIGQAKAGDTLLCCFYEFRYEPVARALASAITAGVDVKIIIDAKVNEYTDSKDVFHPSFPRRDNLSLISTVGIPRKRVIRREARPSDIQHNKFMVLLRGARRQPAEVWTGSTNISLGAFSGQTNVGHWLRDAEVAAQYQTYWELLSQDPGGKADDSASASKKANAAFRAAVEAIRGVPDTPDAIPKGVTPVFSPRASLAALDLYVNLVDSAAQASFITLAFGIGQAFREQLKDNTAQSHITFILLEKKDAPNPRSKQTFVAINASNNVYKAWGAYIEDPVYQWARETNARALDLNEHVSYVHSKFLMRDPLGDDPIVVTGSANFSDASTKDNDENMVIIRGNARVADIYFTEFNRLFNHYYFRSVVEDLQAAGRKPDDASLFLAETDGWLGKYEPGTFRAKRLALYTEMQGAVG